MKIRNFKKNDDFERLFNLVVDFEFDKQISIDTKKLNRKEVYSNNHKNLTEFLEDKTCKYFICAVDKEIIGYIFVSYDKNYSQGYINEVYIIPEKRLNGFGIKLVEKGIQWLHDKKCKTIDITVNNKNKPAKGLYKKLGFAIHKDDYITMRKI